MRHGCDVLLVDDDLDVVDLVADVLMAEGCRVRTAVDGREALDILAKWRPQIILLDIMMPVMDGTDVLETIRADPALARIPVVVISASGAHLSQSLPAAAVIAKPFSIDHLLQQVTALARQ
jgi:CheY-like chemotaxis protein